MPKLRMCSGCGEEFHMEEGEYCSKSCEEMILGPIMKTLQKDLDRSLGREPSPMVCDSSGVCTPREGE